ncbi:hypothetical protein lpymt_02615 [Legionella pneumophila]|nr:hypothetical protein lpymt_02615 [Legionella pneumophila]
MNNLSHTQHLTIALLKSVNSMLLCQLVSA